MIFDFDKNDCEVINDFLSYPCSLITKGLLNVTSRDIGLETYRKAEDTGSDYTDDSDDNQSTHAATASARKGKVTIDMISERSSLHLQNKDSPKRNP